MPGTRVLPYNNTKMQEGITAAVADAERVVKKQKTCSTRSLDSISALLQEVQAAKKQLSKHGEPQTVSAEDMGIQGACMRGDHANLTLQVLQELQRRIAAINTPVKLAEATKDLHSSIHKLSKVNWGPCAEPQLENFAGRLSPGHHQLSIHPATDVHRAPACICTCHASQWPICMLQSVDKPFVGDICQATRELEMDPAVLNQASCQSVLLEGICTAIYKTGCSP